MQEIIKVLRPKHWSKNLLVFIIPLLSNSLEIKELGLYMCYFMIISLFISGTYIINDLIDIESDKNHPIKKNRPIASGLVSKKKAIILISLLSTSTLIISFVISKILFIFLIIYFLFALSYSLFFKFIKYFDLFYLTSFFILRITLGAYLFESNVTIIFILFTFFSTGTISIAKKYSILNSDLIKKSKIKKSLQNNYSNKGLFFLFIFFAFVTNIIFGIWIFSNNYIYNFPIFINTILYLLMSIFLFYLYVFTKTFESEDIINLVLRKKQLTSIALLFVLFFMYGLNFI